MACRRLSLSTTACGLLLIPLLVPGLFVLLVSPSTDQVGAQELGPKQQYLSGQRPAETPRSSASGAPTNQAPKPAGKMGFVPASPTPRDNTSKPPRSVANPVTRRAVPQPPKYAVAAGAAPEAPRVRNSDTRSVAARPVQQPQQPPPTTIAQPQPKTVANQAVVKTLPARSIPQELELPDPTEEPLPEMESEEPTETNVAVTQPLQFRMVDEPTEEEMPPFEEPADEPVLVQPPARNVVQSFFEDDAADDESDELMVVDDEPTPETKRDDVIHSVMPQRSVAQQAAPLADSPRFNSREIGRKQSYASGQRSADAPRGSANHASTNPATKPSNKLSFTPASPATRDGAPNDPRSVANPVARRTMPLPPKYAVSAPPALETQQSPKSDSRAVVSRSTKPQPNALANKPSAPQQAEPPRLPVETLEPVPSIAKSEASPFRTLEEPLLEEPPLVEPLFEEPPFEKPVVAKQPTKGVVQLYFDDEPSDGDSEETMELTQPSTPISRASGIQHVAAQADATQGTAKVENADQQEDTSAKAEKERMVKIMSDLRPVREVDVRLAVKLPMPGENDSDKVREPDDQALAVLRHRKPFNIFAVSREPWTGNRDSYPFFHKPLWFEDPNLERCGRGYGLFTTAVSAVHFSANIPILPYRFTAEKPWSCVRTLPDCTVCERFGHDAYLPPWSLSAAAVQAAATVGIIYLVP